MNKKIAILGTGSELIRGDLLNTNGQYAAQCFEDQGICTGMHMLVSDEQAEITQAIHFLIESHDALLIIGGLGPTQDDRTRFALSDATSIPLVFFEPTWNRITQRITQFKTNVPENNKTQALFPEGANVFPNENGTADACRINYLKKTIYMLPGPPREFLPIFDQYVLPDLVTSTLSKPVYKSSWLLLNVSEGHISNQLDQLVDDSVCELGYRVHYPYLEVKLRSFSSSAHSQYAKLIEEEILTHLVSRKRKIASKQLKTYLANLGKNIFIQDDATGGQLKTSILTPDNHPYLDFSNLRNSYDPNDYIIKISGLERYWLKKMADLTHITLTVHIEHNAKQFKKTKEISVYTHDITYYATETVCWILLNYLKAHEKPRTT